MAGKNASAPPVAMTIRLHPDLMRNVEYWAARKEMSKNEYICWAVEHAIAWENRDYDLPTAEVQRLNQLVDVIESLSSNVKSLEDMTQAGFDSLLGLTRGVNYLLEEDAEG